MGPSGALARTWLRRNVLASVLLACLVAVLVATAGGAFAAARRSSSALDRFLEHSRPPDLQVFGEGLDLDAVVSLPQVVGWATGSYGLLTAEGPGGGPFPAGDVNPFLSIESAGEPLYRPYVVHGREPAPENASEVAIDEQASSRLGAGVGDELVIRLFLPDQIEELYESGEFPVPRGRTTTVTVTGIVRQPFDVVPVKPDDVDSVALASSDMYFTSGFWAEHGGDMAAFGDGNDGVELLLRHGASDVEAVESAVRAMPGGDGLAVETSNDAISAVADARQTVRFQAVALALFGSLALLAGSVLIGQALSRQVRSELEERHLLVAMGLVRRDLARAVVLRVFPVAMGGAGVGMVGAWLSSARTPIGLAATAEVDPGMRLDVLPVIGVAVATILVTCGSGAWAAWHKRSAQRGRARLALGGRMADRAARAGAPVGVVAGLSFLTPVGPRSPVRSSLGAVIFGIAMVTGLVVWATSLERFVRDPTEHGWNWDLVVGDSDDPELSAAADHTLAPDPLVKGYAAVTSGYEEVVTAVADQPHDVAIVGIDPLAGETYVSLQAGGPAETAQEAVVGARTLERVGASLGDTLVLEGPRGRSGFEIVGIAVLHQLVSDEFELDEGVVVTADGLRTLFTGDHVVVGDTGFDDGVQLSRYLVDVAEGSSVSEASASLREAFGPTVTPHLPPLDVASLRGTTGLPWALGAMVGLLAAASLLHLLVTTVRRHRGAFAVMASLGASRRMLTMSVLSTATATVVIATAVGVPLGLIVGRLAWSAVAVAVGSPTSPVVPVLMIGAASLAVVVAANVVAVAPGRLAHRLHPADILRSE